MFEVLSLLGEQVMPDFLRRNWKSNIRHYVNIHPEYSSLTPWGGSETADFEYRDTTGLFTSFLADKGYMSNWSDDVLRQARPLYYLEVKATTGGFRTPCYMSKRQYQRVRTIALRLVPMHLQS